ncbi:MAG TPA: hypothetical protein VGG04_17880 [Candidatus Sulfotelmatobacter sp.]|jgi:hypothetical protein
MTNTEFIRLFEADSLPGEFRHADHVRLAFAYLSEYPALEGLEKFCSALKSYAAARGQAQRYHETITYSLFFLIRERMAREGARDWNTFEGGNLDLFRWKDGVLSRYYEQSTIDSDMARSIFVLPDKLREV